MVALRIDENELAEAKAKISTAVDILLWELADMMGHVSVRTPDGEHFLMRHLRPPEDPSIPEDDVVAFDLDGKKIFGKRAAGGKGSEIYFHTCPYKARRDVGAVIHCHPPLTIALAAAGRTIVPLTHRHKFTEVPIVPWIYGSLPEHGEIATRAMGDNCAVVIEGHGAVVTGETLEEACVNMVQLEQAAKMILLAGPLGKLKPIPADAVKTFRSLVEVRQAVSGRPLAEWRYWESQLRKGRYWTKF
ncbi:MAG TPA: class II aldolase/adducin family protein [Candidatus Acidoferrales bacterium]|nr:class II aldolase/adducin family protein [Candidatus Acidoferrales bacterium]